MIQGVDPSRTATFIISTIQFSFHTSGKSSDIITFVLIKLKVTNKRCLEPLDPPRNLPVRCLLPQKAESPLNFTFPRHRWRR